MEIDAEGRNLSVVVRLIAVDEEDNSLVNLVHVDQGSSVVEVAMQVHSSRGDCALHYESDTRQKWGEWDVHMGGVVDCSIGSLG